MSHREIVERYFAKLAQVRGTGAGVAEQSYYAALEGLLDAVGGLLKPRVLCVHELANAGAGEPDFGLYTQEQAQRGGQAPLPGQLPARGVVEVKAPEEEAAFTAAGDQTRRYLSHYGLVLVTNYRAFLLVGLVDGKPAILETFTLAPTAADFWALLAHPRAAARDHGEALCEFLRRALLANAPLAAPKDVAWFLASYAREAKARAEAADAAALAGVRQALEGALGLTFQGEKGEHFFRSTLVQTLFYGLFAAWVLWRQRGARGRFDWRTAGWQLHVPMIQKLYGELSMPSHLLPLGLVDVLDRAQAMLERVDAAAFFTSFNQEHAVQYFYEPFLEAFDPDLRKELGVWYTPPEIVKYMVARVDRVLREELGIADGLASEDVYVLDPCCGTGAYLVEVLRKIKETLDEAHLGALADLTLKKAATERVFGFEILPAPFVVAHLQLGLLLHTLGEPLADERVGVFLTNALTGWAPPDEQAKARLSQLGLHYPEFKAEYDAAAGVKRGKKILVVLGNPPYNGFAGMAVQEERDLSDAYRRAKRAPQPQGQGLNDLYIRFYRMAERQIVEHAHRGVVCFISNYSWLDGLSFTGMRERYLEAFDTIFIDNLHGDRIISEYAPDGRTSETVFAMQGTSVGIKVGTAIATLVVAEGKGDGQVCYRDFEQARADERRKALLASLDAEDLHPYETLQPVLELGLPFKPRAVRSDYLAWPLLPELFPVSYPGIQPCRDDLVVDITHDRLVSRMKQYFDSAVSNEEIAQISPIALKTTDRYDAIVVRQMLVKRGLLCDNFVPYTYRPFDNRWLYWEPETKLLDEKRAEYVPHVTPNNLWMALAQRNRKAFDPPCVALHHASRHLIERGANLFPLLLRTDQSQGSLFGDAESYRENISAIASVYISQIGCAAEELFFHAIASLHAPQYCSENSGALRQDWPRIPLPASGEALRASAALGRRVAALLDPEAPVTGVTARPVRGELAIIAAPAQIVGGGLRAEELALTAGWGHAGQGGVTMPGRGDARERAYTAEERAALGEAAALLGETTFDLYLNAHACWRNVPARVWAYTLGGYPVLKKWLSYREEPLLKRPLKPEEAQYFSEVARRIAALLLLAPELDANYRAVTAATYAWRG